MKHEKTKIELKLYGLPQEAGDVRGDVFVKKMDILLKSLRAADQHQNGQKTLEYLIKGMEYGSAYTRMSEFQYNTEKVPMVSAIEAVHSVIESVKDGKGIPSDTPLALAKSVANLGKGCEKTFSHGEIGLVGRAIIEASDDQPFYNIEISGINGQDFAGQVYENSLIQGCIGKYFSQGNFTESNGDGFLYTHKGTPLTIQSLRVRILDTQMNLEPGLGPNSALILEINTVK